jgi:hypothetical protein
MDHEPYDSLSPDQISELCLQLKIFSNKKIEAESIEKKLSFTNKNGEIEERCCKISVALELCKNNRIFPIKYDGVAYSGICLLCLDNSPNSAFLIENPISKLVACFFHHQNNIIQ